MAPSKGYGNYESKQFDCGKIELWNPVVEKINILLFKYAFGSVFRINQKHPSPLVERLPCRPKIRNEQIGEWTLTNRFLPHLPKPRTYAPCLSCSACELTSSLTLPFYVLTCQYRTHHNIVLTRALHEREVAFILHGQHGMQIQSRNTLSILEIGAKADESFHLG